MGIASRTRILERPTSAWWGKYIRESGKDVSWFERDPIHANFRGEQILGHILAAHLGPPVNDPTRK